jgi:hypothetical protein
MSFTAEEVRSSSTHAERSPALESRRHGLDNKRRDMFVAGDRRRIAKREFEEIKRAAARPSDRRHPLAKAILFFELGPLSWADAEEILLPLTMKCEPVRARTAAEFVADKLAGDLHFSREAATVALYRHGGVIEPKGRKPSFKFSAESDGEIDARHAVMARQLPGLETCLVTTKAAAEMIGSNDPKFTDRALRHMAWCAALQRESIAPFLLVRRTRGAAPPVVPTQEQADTFAALLRKAVNAVDAVTLAAVNDIKAGKVGEVEALTLEAALPAPSQWTGVLADLCIARALGGPREAETVMERLLDAVQANGGD